MLPQPSLNCWSCLRAKAVGITTQNKSLTSRLPTTSIASTARGTIKVSRQLVATNGTLSPRDTARDDGVVQFSRTPATGWMVIVVYITNGDVGEQPLAVSMFGVWRRV